MSKQTHIKPEELLLYAVTDRHWLNGATLISQVEAALKGGATFIQLREKNLDDKAFYQEALEIQKLCKEYKVPFVINDNVELAKKIGADGVHVGQSDMEALDVRKVLGDDKIIGVSAQTVVRQIWYPARCLQIISGPVMRFMRWIRQKKMIFILISPCRRNLPISGLMAG